MTSILVARRVTRRLRRQRPWPAGLDGSPSVCGIGGGAAAPSSPFVGSTTPGSSSPRIISPDNDGSNDDDVRMVAAAADGSLVIGRGGQLPWDLPEVGVERDRYVCMLRFPFYQYARPERHSCTTGDLTHVSSDMQDKTVTMTSFIHTNQCRTGATSSTSRAGISSCSAGARTGQVSAPPPIILA